ncbi:MAG: class I SAM-dependent methyltransferase [Tepidisphaeraceae bacterium]
MTEAWNDDLLKDPHAVQDKRRRVRDMFAAIAPKYDLNNRLHSFGRDQAWRRKAVKLAELKPSDIVVDVACGTGDLTLAFYDTLLMCRSRAERKLNSPEPFQILGVDFTFEMLPPASAKAASSHFGIHLGCEYKRFGEERGKRLPFLNGDATALPLADASADIVSIAFGIRNVQQPMLALREFFRVLRPGGRVIVLEFSQPKNRLIRWANDLYCAKIMPHTATWISGDKSGAYKYLPMSVKTFMNRETMMQMMRDAGFVDVTQHPMTFGVCVCYRGFKR